MILVIIVLSFEFRAIETIDGKNVIEKIDEFLRVHLIGIGHTKVTKTSCHVKCCQSFGEDRKKFILDIVIIEQIIIVEFKKQGGKITDQRLLGIKRHL